MKKLTIKQILDLHNILLDETGGLFSVRNMGLLDSAFSAPFTTFDGKDYSPSLESKAAKLGSGIIKKHPFVDGNKSTGLLVMLVFLELNNIELKYSDDELINIGLAIANDRMGDTQLVVWIKTHAISTHNTHI